MHEFLQQLINGLSLGAIYALIALGYSMVYGLLKFINFAHGDVLMIGAFAGFYATPVARHLFPHPWMTTTAVLIWAMIVCAILGVIIERLAYRPLRNQPKLAVLITSIGVSLLLSYGGQILFGVNQKAFPDLLPPIRIALGEGVTISGNHLLVIAVTLVLLVTLREIVLRSRFGLALRALSQNRDAAALMGVNSNAVISLTFAVGSALAGAAGVLYAMNIHSIEPLMGTQPGIKAFVAAVLGGIGSLPGAAVGGLLLGLSECLLGGSFLSSYRDAIAFGILIVILLIRPAGLFGSSAAEKV
ncbi:MAG: branched-chain amino acid ABC transporter permease [Chthoniobacterales bacterium]|nr:branched-chain amino acid ABC transporter permease [Chthoniobacterales bacterium]